MAIKFDKNFLAGLGGGIATGANKVIQADLAANSAKVSKMAGFAAERALKKRDEYDADLKEFEKGVKQLSGKLGENGMDTAQFLISEYGSVEAAEAASVKLIERAQDMGTSVYEQLKLRGVIEMYQSQHSMKKLQYVIVVGLVFFKVKMLQIKLKELNRSIYHQQE